MKITKKRLLDIGFKKTENIYIIDHFLAKNKILLKRENKMWWFKYGENKECWNNIDTIRELLFSIYQRGQNDGQEWGINFVQKEVKNALGL